MAARCCWQYRPIGHAPRPTRLAAGGKSRIPVRYFLRAAPRQLDPGRMATDRGPADRFSYLRAGASRLSFGRGSFVGSHKCSPARPGPQKWPGEPLGRSPVRFSGSARHPHGMCKERGDSFAGPSRTNYRRETLNEELNSARQRLTRRRRLRKGSQRTPRGERPELLTTCHRAQQGRRAAPGPLQWLAARTRRL
jgi:hypothetical protein